MIKTLWVESVLAIYSLAVIFFPLRAFVLPWEQNVQIWQTVDLLTVAIPEVTMETAMLLG